MTRDEVIALAREAGAHWEYNRSHPVPCVFGDDGSLLRFAALVAADEREACAATAERCIKMERDVSIKSAKAIAFAIRERGER